MQAALKLLVATACLCVIAATGYYFYKERQSQIADERARSILLQTAQQEANDAQKAREAGKRARSEARAERKKAREEEKARIERARQADRDNAAEILKDAVVE